jgi:hypothetical protein
MLHVITGTRSMRRSNEEQGPDSRLRHQVVLGTEAKGQEGGEIPGLYA